MDNVNNAVERPDELVAVGDHDPFKWDSAPDHMLRTLVDLVNLGSISFGVTLIVSGFLVSGQMTSGLSFFEGLSEEMASSYTDDNEETKESIRKYFLGFGDVYNGYREQTNKTLPVFIHLKDTKFFHPSGKPIPGNRGIWWRGRIESISGFSMGSLNAD